MGEYWWKLSGESGGGGCGKGITLMQGEPVD